jgi:cathepsin L
MKVAIALLALVAVASAIPLNMEFESWKRTHSKEYSNAVEELNRRAVWESNKVFVEAHNSAGIHTYTLAMNAFADLTHEEFRRFYLGTKVDLSRESNNTFVADTPVEALPTSVDWRTSGIVTAVKDQGQCGSCWSFSTTGSVEGQHARKTGSLVSLSEQNLVDCSTAQGNAGCNGGLMDDAFTYIIKNKGIDTEASYPYTAKDGTCKFTAANVGATISSYTDIARGSETDLQTAVANVGPVSVAIDASKNSFQLYSSGVYNEKTCSSTSLDHGVLAAGYGVSGTTAYWLVKNSWGASWGQAGYIWMSRNANNQCGIATSASYPVV